VGAQRSPWGCLLLGYVLGISSGDSPEWVWLVLVLGVDVAHVWSTLYRVYLDPAELRRRPLVYAGVPLCCYAAGVALHASSSMLFWRALAYLALFHFVRQQAGWLKLYHRRLPPGRWDAMLEVTTLYACMIYPVLHWHAHLPRRFAWFVQGDFVAVPSTAMVALASAAAPVYGALLVAFGLRSAQRFMRGDVHPGVVLLVLSTAACWAAGIVLTNADYAFTVTNVLIHGIPYLGLTLLYGQVRGAQLPGSVLWRIMRAGLPVALLVLLGLAFAEEWLWDRFVWQERGWLFGEGTAASSASPGVAGAVALVAPDHALRARRAGVAQARQPRAGRVAHGWAPRPRARPRDAPCQARGARAWTVLNCAMNSPTCSPT
jgi:hypothetical protein